MRNSDFKLRQIGNAPLTPASSRTSSIIGRISVFALMGGVVAAGLPYNAGLPSAPTGPITRSAVSRRTNLRPGGWFGSAIRLVAWADAPSASDPSASSDIQGALNFEGSAYTVRDGQIFQGEDQVGNVVAAFPASSVVSPAVDNASSNAPPSLSLRYRLSGPAGEIRTGDLITTADSSLEGTTLQVGGIWWAYAANAWVRLGKPVSGHTYPGFEVAGGGNVTQRAQALLDLYRSDKRLGVHPPRGINPRTLSRKDLNLLQQIADVETEGQVACINTYDNQAVSFGLRQWTLGSGRLQRLIRDNAGAFARYGIAAYAGDDPDPTHYLVVAGARVPGIEGATSTAELTGPYWSARFFRAGQDPEIIAATLKLAARELYQSLDGDRTTLSEAMALSRFFRHSATARALLAELENNRPAYAAPVVTETVIQTTENPPQDEDGFLQDLTENIARPYEEEFVRRASRAVPAAMVSPASKGSPDPADVARASGDHFAARWMAEILGVDSTSLYQQLCAARLAREAAIQTPPPAPVVTPAASQTLPVRESTPAPLKAPAKAATAPGSSRPAGPKPLSDRKPVAAPPVQPSGAFAEKTAHQLMAAPAIAVPTASTPAS